MKPNNKQLKKLRDNVTELQKELFNTLGGNESFHHRVKLGDIANSILQQMKENQINGDESINIWL